MKEPMLKSILKLALCGVLCFSMVPAAAFASATCESEEPLFESSQDVDTDGLATGLEADEGQEKDGEREEGEESSLVSSQSDLAQMSEDTAEAEMDQIEARAAASVVEQNGFRFEYDDSSRALTISGNGALSAVAGLDTTLDAWLADADKLIIGPEVTSMSDYLFVDFVSFSSYLTACTTVQFLGQGDFGFGAGVFFAMPSLKTVILPSGLTSISSALFSGCTNLESIVFPSSLEFIGNGSFYGCTSLEKMLNENGKSSFLNLLKVETGALKDTKINGVIEINGDCFIEQNAFSDKVTIKLIKDWVTAGVDETSGIKWEVATQGADKVLTLSYTGSGNGVIPAGSYGSSAGGVAKWLDATDPDVYSSKGITKIILGEGIVELSEWCFNNANGIWPNVKSISLPASVQKIGENAFTSLATMTSFTIAPNSQLKELTPATGGSPRGAWGNCSSLAKLDLSSTQLTAWTPEIMGCSNLSELVFPATLGSIGENSLSSTPKLTHLVVPTNVSQIHENAFNASSIQEVVLSCPVVLSSIPSGLKMIYCGLTEAQVREANLLPNDPRYDDALALSEALWNNSAIAGNYTLTFQPHQCSAGHALPPGSRST